MNSKLLKILSPKKRVFSSTPKINFPIAIFIKSQSGLPINLINTPMSRISCRKVKKILKKNFRKKTLLLKVIWLYPKERTVEIQFFYELFNICLFQTNYRYSVLCDLNLDKLKQRFPIKCECHKGGVSNGFVSYFYILHSAQSYIKVFPILSSGMLVCVSSKSFQIW